MASHGKIDYHVHYFTDSCVADEMTLQNISAEAVRLGLEEICILKHYSKQLPNKQGMWVSWKRIVPKQFDAFLKDIRSFSSPNELRMLAGVETELLDYTGKINIPKCDIAKLDVVSLSVHWFPNLEFLPVDPILCPSDIGKNSAEAAAHWLKQIKDVEEKYT